MKKMSKKIEIAFFSFFLMKKSTHNQFHTIEMFTKVLLFFTLISYVFCDPVNKYCKENTPLFVSRNPVFVNAAGKWTSTTGVYFPVGGDRDNLIRVSLYDYYADNTYIESQCAFRFVLAYPVFCDSTLCPSVTPGVYTCMVEDTTPLNVPDGNEKECKQTYGQNYLTPLCPGFPDQTTTVPYVENYNPRVNMAVYSRPSDSFSVYEEVMSIDVPNNINGTFNDTNKGHRWYSAALYIPSFTVPGETDMVWVLINSKAMAQFPEPQLTTYNQYMAGTLNLTEWAPGKSAYMSLVTPFSSKRSTSSDRLTNSLQKLKDLNVKVPLVH